MVINEMILLPSCSNLPVWLLFSFLGFISTLSLWFLKHPCRNLKHTACWNQQRLWLIYKTEHCTIHNWPLNNIGLKCLSSLISRFFSIVTIKSSTWSVVGWIHRHWVTTDMEGWLLVIIELSIVQGVDTLNSDFVQASTVYLINEWGNESLC